MTSPEAGAKAFFTAAHRACEVAWASLEETAKKGDGAANQASWRRFDGALRRHFAMEEEVLFPALEAVTGTREGPTAAMRVEHAQMRALLDEMAQRAQVGDFEGLLDHGDALLMLTQQHNAKEESTLYPLADRVLVSSWNELADRLRAYQSIEEPGTP